MIEQQKKQALLPASCEILPNAEGTAPGFARRSPSGKCWYFMPGVPKEMRAMFLAHVLPELPRIAGYRSSTWATQFTSEGELQSRLNGVHRQLPSNFEITYRTRFPENHIGLHGVCATEEDRGLYERLASEIERALGSSVFSGGIGKEIAPLENVVVDLLTRRKRVLGTVESCTGGLIANRITDVPGSSAAYWSSWVVYDNSSKLSLGVDPELLQANGAVSPQVARALAESGLAALQKLGAVNPVCVATTGIAGPGGGSEQKPVGLCYIAVAGLGETKVSEVRGRPYLKRAEYKLLFSQKALDEVRLLLVDS